MLLMAENHLKGLKVHGFIKKNKIFGSKFFIYNGQKVHFGKKLWAHVRYGYAKTYFRIVSLQYHM